MTATTTHPSRTTPQTIFFLGATGFLGSLVLANLADQAPQHKIVALLRPGGSSVTSNGATAPGSATVEEKLERLRKVHPNVVRAAEGSLDDKEVIEREAEAADVVLNCASSDHLGSVLATLAGLERNSAKHPGTPPIYIHISGCGIISDNARGELKDVKDIPEYSDLGLDLRKCPQGNMHLESDIPIVDAATREKNPIRSLILFPAQIYGISNGIQPTTLWVRIFLDMARKLGYAGTWGPGHNAMNNVHVRDVAAATTLLLLRALDGTTSLSGEGAEGLYFCASMERRVTYKEWTAVMGDILFEKGLIKEKGTRSMPPAVVDPLGHYGWSLLGGNQFSRPERLATLGWTPSETSKQDMMAALPAMIDLALVEMGWTKAD